MKMDGVLAVAHLQIHNYLGDAAKNSDEIENIPSISKVVLRQKPKNNNNILVNMAATRHIFQIAEVDFI